jgi:hypothetical protein
MFGKGVYMADISSKSAGYCSAQSSGNTALLLLCEAELGKPMQELTQASSNAGTTAKQKGMFSTWGKGRTGPKGWKDASCVNKNLEGVKMVYISFSFLFCIVNLDPFALLFSFLAFSFLFVLLSLSFPFSFFSFPFFLLLN